MKEKKILLISLDREYTEKVEGKIAFLLNEYSRLEIIDSREYLTEYLKTDHPKIDVLIADESIYADALRVQPSDKSYRLVEGSKEADSVSKYEADEGILSAIGKDFLKNTEHVDETTHVINVVSADGGSGKTRAAIGIAAQLAALGGRVLYIDAEEVQNFGEFLQTQGDNKWAKDTMSLAFMNPQADANALNEHIQRGAFDYVPAFKSPLFAYNIGLQSYYNMAEELAAGRQYEYIVIEHGNALTKDLAMFLGKSTTIVMCTDQGIGAAERIERFMDNLIDFKGQCMLLCSQYDEGESDFGQNPIVYRYPVCETVRRQRERTTPEEMLAKGLYRAAAAAVR
ncbi:MAG: AAA family ATPase [Butyrivibrio sp.]|nr:AAA family ATPase [Butyrivibrio sp.]